jgi:two-component SAPR family response regulator
LKTRLGVLCIRKGYVIAKNKDEHDRMKYYAIVIQELERELGIKVSSYPELKLKGP